MHDAQSKFLNLELILKSFVISVIGIETVIIILYKKKLLKYDTNMEG